MGAFDLVKFIQAMYPCVQANYPQLINGVTQLVGGASILFTVFKYFQAPAASGAPASPLSGIMKLLNTVALNPKL